MSFTFKEESTTPRFFGYLLFIANSVFIAYLVTLMVNSGLDEALSVYKPIRDYAYYFYVAIFMLIGLRMLLVRSEMTKEFDLKRGYPGSSLLLALVIQVIITNFAYAISLAIFKALSFLGAI